MCLSTAQHSINRWRHSSLQLVQQWERCLCQAYFATPCHHAHHLPLGITHPRGCKEKYVCVKTQEFKDDVSQHSFLCSVLSSPDHRECLELLLSCGAHIDMELPVVGTPLYSASLAGSTACVELLLHSGNKLLENISNSYRELL